MDVFIAVNVDQNNDNFHKNKIKILVFHLEEKKKQILKMMKSLTWETFVKSVIVNFLFEIFYKIKICKLNHKLQDLLATKD